jgi:deazaflavin-dependent oxidoreductase (nitroreductase family)
MHAVNILMKLFVKGHVWLYETSGGRRGTTMQGRKLILLTTTGRKSGQPRTVPVVPYIDGNEMFVMASMGGAPSHPAWYANLLANPEVGVQLGPDRWRARATPVEGEERDRLWKRITQVMPNFGKYQEKTSRVIPVVRLTRLSSPASN